MNIPLVKLADIREKKLIKILCMFEMQHKFCASALKTLNEVDNLAYLISYNLRNVMENTQSLNRKTIIHIIVQVCRCNELKTNTERDSCAYAHQGGCIQIQTYFMQPCTLLEKQLVSSTYSYIHMFLKILFCRVVRILKTECSAN